VARFTMLKRSSSSIVSQSAVRLLLDALRFMLLGFRSRSQLAAENLFLRKQLALYRERRVKPRRADDATRVSLVVLSQYSGLPTNYRSLQQFYRAVRRHWRTWLNRRTRGKTLDWGRFAQLLLRHPLLRPRITHAWAASGSSG